MSPTRSLRRKALGNRILASPDWQIDCPRRIWECRTVGIKVQSNKLMLALYATTCSSVPGGWLPSGDSVATMYVQEGVTSDLQKAFPARPMAADRAQTAAEAWA